MPRSARWLISSGVLTPLSPNAILAGMLPSHKLTRSSAALAGSSTSSSLRAAPAAIMNAVTDALGVKDLAMPASPERVWRALRGA